MLARSDREEFLRLAAESRDLHRPWTYPPEHPEQFDELYARSRRDDCVCLLACLRDGGQIAGVLIISQIVRGAFQSAYLGYYAHERHAGSGYMREAMVQTVDHAFGPLALHRLEANIQPAQRRLDRARALGRLPARGLLAALPADRRAVARPRALRDHGRRPRGGLEEPELRVVVGGPARRPARPRPPTSSGSGTAGSAAPPARAAAARRAPAARAAARSPRAASPASRGV